MDPARPTPMGIWELVGTAIRVYISNANSLILIVAVIAVPFTILITLLLNAALPEELVNFDPARGEDALSGLTVSDFSSFIVVGLIGGILSFVVSMVAIGACFVVVGDALRGESTGWMDAIRRAVAKLGSLVWLPLLVGLLLFGGAIAGIIVIALLGQVASALAAIAAIALFCAFIYVAVLWSVAVPALMDEDVRGTRALARSGELIKGRWWPTLGAYVVAFLIILVVSIVLDAIFGGGDASQRGLILTVIGSAVSQILITPFQAAIVGVVYFDLRARKAPAQSAPTMGTPPGPMGGAPPPPPPSTYP